MKFLILIFLAVFPLFLAAQTSVLTQGNLVYFNVNQNEINRADTIGHWKDLDDEFELISSSEFYSKLINFNDKKYFIKLYDPGCILCEGFFYYLENYESNTKLYLGTYNSENVNLPFNIFSTNNAILSFFSFDYAIDKSDSVHTLYNPDTYSLVNIIGETDSLYWCNFKKGKYDQKFALLDLNNFPELDTASIKWMYYQTDFQPYDLISKVQKIDSNLYLFELYYRYVLGSFINDSIKIVKEFPNLPKTKWSFKKPNLFFDGGGRYAYLQKWKYNPEDTTFIFQGNIIEGSLKNENYDIDDHFNYLTYMQNDSLHLFNIEQENIEKSWDLSEFNNPRLPFLVYPEIYFHQTLSVTSLEENTTLPEEFAFTAYPNPFNSQVTFRIETQGIQPIKLTIYDILGKQIYSRKLEKNEIKKFSWQPTHLNSGLYFAVLKSGRNIKTKKLVLIR